MMKFLFENKRTLRFLDGDPINTESEERGSIRFESSTSLCSTSANVSGSSNNSWVIIGLFVSNFDGNRQSRWDTMLQGALLQLLQARPQLVERVLRFLDKRKFQWQIATLEEGLSMTEDLLTDILLYCKKSSTHPFKALIVLDGLDELEDDEHARMAVVFLKKLADDMDSTKNTFKVCISSRPEQTFRDLFVDLPRIEVQEHTRDDIRTHVTSALCENPRFTVQASPEEGRVLGDIVDYICAHADGVFLWAYSISKMVDTGLRKGDRVDQVFQHLKALPTEMKDLYRFIMAAIDPGDRQRVYIMLEVVLRARGSVTLVELALIVTTVEEFLMNQSPPNANHPPTHNYYSTIDPKDFLDSSRLVRQLNDNCRCMLEICGAWEPEMEFYGSSFYGRIHRLQLASGRQYLDEVHEETSETYTRSHQFEDGVSISSTDDSTPSSSIHEQNMERHDETELLTRVQYRDYHGILTLDPSRSIVRLLHRSARDFLLDEGCLDSLFEMDPTQKPKGNGHAFILLFARRWIKASDPARRQLRCHFDHYSEICFHAPLLDRTLSGPEAGIFFPILDEIDRDLSAISPHHESWPVCVIGSGMNHWEFTFPAFGVANNMYGYINHQLHKAKTERNRDHFLNGKPERPLLHFAVYAHTFRPSPKMATYLISQGANIEAKFEEKTAIESLVLDRFSKDAERILGIFKVLIEAGAHANSRYYPYGQDRRFWHPLLHIVALDYIRELEPRLEFMKLLSEHGADLNAQDSDGISFLEVLYYVGETIPSAEWNWLLSMGAKITKGMLCRSADESELNESHVQSIETNLSEDSDDSDDSISSKNERWAPVRVFRLLQLRGDYASSNLEKGRKYHEAFSLRAGLCDDGGSIHDAFQVLRQRKFRNKKWYNLDAVVLAEELRPGWFSN